jgi:uncharacterized membrane protein
VIADLRRQFRERWTVAVALSAILSVSVLAMLVVRMGLSSIAWNLLLAWIPLGLAIIVYRRAASGLSAPVMMALLGVLWLLFLPNAPYLVTDLKYANLKYIDGYTVHVLYDVLLLSLAACTGLLLGCTSLFLMHSVVRRLVGVVTAWVFVVACLALSAVGVYLGRVHRWNSWDVIARPGSLVAQVGSGLLKPLNHPHLFVLTSLLTSFLIASYVLFYFLLRVGSASGAGRSETNSAAAR